MREIVYVINSIQKNGPSVVLENMVKGLDQHSTKIRIITFLNEDDAVIVARFKALGATYTNFGYTTKKQLLLKGVDDLQRYIDATQPSAIHSHGLFPDYVIARLSTKATKITTVHNLPFEDYRNRFGWIVGTLVAKWEISMFKEFDSIVCCSETSYNHVRKYLTKNVTYIRNSINNVETWDTKKERTRTKLRKELGILGKDTVYIFVGGLVPGKDVRFLVDNFKAHHLPNEKLIILGEGPELEYCQINKDDSILLLGFKKNVNDYYVASDIYISASKSEGFSISVLEALENGLHLFLSDIPAHKEVFRVNKRIFIGNTFSANSFAADIVILRKKLLNSNRNKVINFKNRYFTAKSMMSQYEKVYSRR